MVKLPTPSVISFSKKSLKKMGIPVDRCLPDGTYEIKPEYRRFAALVSRTSSLRGDKKLKKQEIKEAWELKAKGKSQNSESSILIDAPEPTLFALALQESILANTKFFVKTQEIGRAHV